MRAELARSPLSHRVEDLRAMNAIEVPFLAQIDLRLDPSHAQRLTIPLPLEANTWTVAGALEVLWLGPDEWLVVGGTLPALQGIHHSIVDVSAGRAVVELRGPDRHDVLASGCGLDLHPRAWRPGMCAQTLFARAQVLLQEREGATRLFVRPSFADYVVDRLLAATGA